MRKRESMRRVSPLLGVLAMVIVLPITGLCEVPQQVNFQGQLTDDVGNPLDGNHVMVFSIYDVSTGGPALWLEEQIVTVTHGIYHVRIGQDPVGNPFPYNLFDGQRWLGVTIESDTEMTPRQALTSTPFAMRAETVVDGAVGTVHLSDNAVTSEKVVDGAVTSAKIADGSITATDIYDGSGSGLDADRLDGLEASDFAAASTLAQLEARIAQLEALLANVTRPGVDTIRFSNVNVQIVNGTGTTAGTGNGRGNLIVGYNENTVAASRTGSHNLVIGIDHGYTSYAGFLAGRHNKISGTSSSVMGYGNEVTASYSSVSGGYFNTASGIYSSVSGGYANTTSAAYASVSGGRDNTAGGNYASISGGRNNEASGMSSFVAGGGGANDIDGNIAFADFSAILGGLNNLTGDGSCVWDLDAGRFVCTGGSDHTIGLQATMSGGRNNTASGDTSSISGGYVNTASGLYSNVGGGSVNTASNDYSSVSGGYNNTASGNSSSVSGGTTNTAIGNSSSVSGGASNTAGAPNSSVSGGYLNTASGDRSSVSGGENNTTSGQRSSICGGWDNTASASYATVSGGLDNEASAYASTLVGDTGRVYVDDTVVH